jgi:hypothetical protein
LEPTTGLATPLDTVARGGSEADAGFYAGFHRVVNMELTTSDACAPSLIRVGYRFVSNQSAPGMSTACFSGSSKLTHWQDLQPAPGHGFYMTVSEHFANRSSKP